MYMTFENVCSTARPFRHTASASARVHAATRRGVAPQNEGQKKKEKNGCRQMCGCAEICRESAGKSAHVQSTDVPAGVWQEAAAVTTDVSGGGSEGLGAVGGAVRGERGDGRESKITPCLVHILKSQFTSSF